MAKHTFSIRVPEEMAIVISERARVAGRDRNAEINELLSFGLVKTASLEKAVFDFVFREVTREELTKLEMGL